MILSDTQLKDHFENEIRRWFGDQGDQTHRINYDLTENSVVMDLGGYEGKWAKTINDKYNCTVHVFEPVEQFYNSICQLFNGNIKVEVYQFALGPKHESGSIAMSADGSSMFGDGERVHIEICSMNEFMISFDNIDLIKINIEGAEYDLLDNMIETGDVTKFKNIQVQFHTFYPNCQERRNKIREQLSKTHSLTYNYDFVWENWKRK